MAAAYEKLLSPYQLNENITLKNRLTSASAQQAMTQGPEKYPTDATIAEMINVCSGGASILCFTHYGKLGGGAAPRKFNNQGYGDEITHFQSYDYDNPQVMNYLSQIATLAHMYGTKIIVRLGLAAPAWPEGRSYLGGDAKSLFPLPKEIEQAYGSRGLSMAGGTQAPVTRTYEEMLSRVCPKDQLQDVIKEVVEECKKYKSCGFDGVSFRCDRFIDESTNLRTDEYSGEVENRGRLCRELFTAIKQGAGSDFLIEGVLMGESDHGHDGELPHGYTLEEAIRFLKTLEDVVDIVQIRERNSAGYQCNGYNSKPHVHKSLDCCRALKESGFKRTISVNGGFHDPEDMEAALQSGACDLVAAARPFIADPLFLKKITSGGAVPTPCIRCNKCHHHIRDMWTSSCSVNPKASLSHKLLSNVKPPLRLKNVAVIGGGPIGMRTACFAAELGHKVTLFEKTGYLGGKLKHADLYSFKWPMKQYRLWLIGEMTRLGVQVKLNHEPAPDELRVQGFDAIIACTGSVARRPEIEGACASGVWTSEDVYEGRAVIGEKVVIVGGGEVAADTAMYLAEQGKNVTVLTRSNLLMKKELRPGGIHKTHELFFPEVGYGLTGAAWDIYPNLKPIYQVTTIKVAPNSVTYIENGVEKTLTCDSVVVNGGYERCVDNALRYVGCAPEFYLAGDVEGGASTCLQQGNLSAYGKANLL